MNKVINPLIAAVMLPLSLFVPWNAPQTHAIAFKTTPQTNGLATVAATANTMATPLATLSSSSLFFVCRNVINAGCQCITSRSVTLTNGGTSTLDIKSITVTGRFTESNTCGSYLGPGKSCAIQVHWSQLSSLGTLTVSDNAASSPQTASLKGYRECVGVL